MHFWLIKDLKFIKLFPPQTMGTNLGGPECISFFIADVIN